MSVAKPGVTMRRINAPIELGPNDVVRHGVVLHKSAVDDDTPEDRENRIRALEAKYAPEVRRLRLLFQRKEFNDA